MKPIDLKHLIIGLLAIIFLSIATGQFGRLAEFAQDQGVKALKPWPSHHFFHSK